MTRERTHRVNHFTLRQLRSKTGYSQRTLAEAVGVSHGFIGQLERGERRTVTAELAVKLETVLGIPVTTEVEEAA